MSDETAAVPGPLEMAIGRAMELFMALAADPDDRETGDQADDAFRALDSMMSGAA